jgi:nucleoside-diphosphate-sugar epimerase
VIHLAGCPGVRDHRPDISTRRWRDNVIAGERVLEATPADVMVVVASSSSVYGGGGSPRRPRACHEDDVLRPRGGYARSKRVLEERCAARAARGSAVGVVRPFTVAGEGQRADMAIARWIDALHASRPIELFGGGDRSRDITDVRDVAEGIIRMLERRVTRTVNLGTGHSHRLDDLVSIVASLCGADPVVNVMPVPADDVASTRADVRRCHDLLGFVPATDLPAIIARQIAVGVDAPKASPGPSTLSRDRLDHQRKQGVLT